MDDLNDVLAAVGPRLRELRRRRGITLADLSSTTGISESTLSRLESGGRRPNLDLLLPLARAHGVPLDELVGAPHTGDPRVHLRPVRRFGMTFVPLTRRAGGVQAYKLVIPAAKKAVEPELKVHEGYEWTYVLSGRLRLLLGDRDLVLEPGEVAEFDTHVPHWLGPDDHQDGHHHPEQVEQTGGHGDPGPGARIGRGRRLDSGQPLRWRCSAASASRTAARPTASVSAPPSPRWTLVCSASTPPGIWTRSPRQTRSSCPAAPH